MLKTHAVRAFARTVDSYRPSTAGDKEGVRRLLAESPWRSGGRFGCYFVADSSPYSDLARAVECSVFQEFFGNEPSTMTAEYGPYEAASSFFLVVDLESQQSAGALRVIGNSEHGLKTLNDIAREPLAIPPERVQRFHRISDLDRCWDVGTVAVLKPYRGRGSNHVVSTMLYGLLRAEASRVGIEHFVAVLDAHAFRQIVEVLGVAFVPIANSPPFAYLGSPSSVAAYIAVPRVTTSIEEHLGRLSDDLKASLQPLIQRVAYASCVPPLVHVAGGRSGTT